MRYDTIETDILVIGTGLSGLTAAYFSMKSEKHVTLIGTGNGASPHITGFNLLSDDADSIDCFIADTMKSGWYQGKRELVNCLCRGSSYVLQLLEALGIELDKTDGKLSAKRPLGSSFPRVVGKGHEVGATIMARMRSLLREAPNVSIKDKTRAVKLLMNSSGIRGALVFDQKQKKFQYFLATAVIIATGGYSRIFPFSTNTTDIGGDGIAMAYEARAELVDLEFIQFEPSVTVYPEKIRGKGIVTTMMHEGAVLRNNDGRRFMLDYSDDGECVNKDVMSLCIYREILKGKGSPHGGVWFDATGMDEHSLQKKYSMFYERYKNCGIDMTKEMVEIAPATHTSLGGVKINTECATNIAGLFACGEVAGGIHGANRIGGNAGLETMVFGRLAGISAGKYMSDKVNMFSQDDEEYLFSNCPKGTTAKKIYNFEKDVELREELSTILWKAMNVIRNGECLGYAKQTIRDRLLDINSMVPADDEELFCQMRLYNDFLTAFLAIASAYQRNGSVGCHVREDDNSQHGESYSVEIVRGNDGPQIHIVPVSLKEET